MTRTCPRKAQDADAALWLDVYPYYRDGHLWESGGASVQPAKYMAAMQLIESTARQALNER